jgi:NADH-quinone oxidoreductase subunit H
MMHLTEFQTFLLLSILKVVVVVVITLMSVAYTVLLERKVLGRIQNRWGPSRVGPFGLMQPLADGIKLFLKEDLMPIASERLLFILAPIIALTCALISISVVPFGGMQRVTVNGVSVEMFNVADVNIGLLVILGITSIGVYGIALSGWSSNNKFALLGSLRATSQMISYELALGLPQPSRHRQQPERPRHAQLEHLRRLPVRRLLHLHDGRLRRDQPRSF